jgi:hypothetical protein
MTIAAFWPFSLIWTRAAENNEGSLNQSQPSPLNCR